MPTNIYIYMDVSGYQFDEERGCRHTMVLDEKSTRVLVGIVLLSF